MAPLRVLAADELGFVRCEWMWREEKERTLPRMRRRLAALAPLRTPLPLTHTHSLPSTAVEAKDVAAPTELEAKDRW